MIRSKGKLLLVAVLIFVCVVLVFFFKSSGQPNIKVLVDGALDENEVQQIVQSMQEQMTEQPKVTFVAGGQFNELKLLSEIATANYSVLILRQDFFDRFSKEDGYVDLSDIADGSQYPEGVMTYLRKQVEVTELSGIPVQQLEWFKQINSIREDPNTYIAVIPKNVKGVQKAKRFLRELLDF